MAVRFQAFNLRVVQNERRALLIDHSHVLEPDAFGILDCQTGGGCRNPNIFQKDICDWTFRQADNDTG